MSSRDCMPKSDAWFRALDQEFTPHTPRETARIKKGWQCPECFGVNTYFRPEPWLGPDQHAFGCSQCGCQWSSPRKNS